MSNDEKKLRILQHALGIDRHGQGLQYRNHFVTGPGSDDHAVCCEIVAEGLMVKRQGSELTGGDDCFFVTPAGIDHVALNSPLPPKLTRSQRRYRDFLDSDSGLTFGEYIRAKR